MTKGELLEAAAKGEGPLGHAADDEPVLVLRAGDSLAAYLAREWADLREMQRCGRARDYDTTRAQVAEFRALADQMDVWAEAHG